jgi:hypothetical protein
MDSPTKPDNRKPNAEKDFVTMSAIMKSNGRKSHGEMLSYRNNCIVTRYVGRVRELDSSSPAQGLVTGFCNEQTVYIKYGKILSLWDVTN